MENKRKYIFRGIDDLIIKKNDVGEKIFMIGLCLNSPCMYNCVYCYAKDKIINNECKMMKLTDYIKLIEEAKDLGCRSVIITGVSSPSEPLLSPILKEVVNSININGMIPIIYTNANILGNDSICEKIHNMNCIEFSKFLFNNNVSLMISCDSINNKYYNLIVCKDDQYTFFKNAMKNILAVGYKGKETNGFFYTRIAITTVISKYNIDELKDICGFSHQNNWQYICKFPSITGNAVKNSFLFFSSDEVKLIREKIYEIPDKYETSTIKDADGNEYCLSNQLGIAVNCNGQPLSCLSGSVFLEDNITIMNTPLSSILNQKKSIFKFNTGRCPHKKKYYEDI